MRTFLKRPPFLLLALLGWFFATAMILCPSLCAQVESQTQKEHACCPEQEGQEKNHPTQADSCSHTTLLAKQDSTVSPLHLELAQMTFVTTNFKFLIHTRSVFAHRAAFDSGPNLSKVPLYLLKTSFIL